MPRGITLNLLIALEQALNSIDHKFVKNLELSISQNVFMPICIPYAVQDIIILPSWINDLQPYEAYILLVKELLHGYWRHLRPTSTDPLIILSTNIIEDRVSSLTLYKLKPNIFKASMELIFDKSLREGFTFRLEMLAALTTLPNKLWKRALEYIPHRFIDGTLFLRTVLLKNERPEIFNEGTYSRVVKKVYSALKVLELDEIWKPLIDDFKARLGHIRVKATPRIRIYNDVTEKNNLVILSDEFNNILVSLQDNIAIIAKTAGIAKVIRNLRANRSLNIIQKAIILLEKVCGKLYPVMRMSEEHDYVTGTVVVGANPRGGGRIIKKTMGRPLTQWLDYRLLESRSCKHIIALDVSGSMKLNIDQAVALTMGMLTYNDILGFIAFDADVADYVKPAQGPKVIKDIITRLISIEADGGTNFKPVAELIDLNPRTWSGDVLTVISDFDMHRARIKRASWKYVNLVLMEETPSITAFERVLQFINEVINERFYKARIWLFRSDTEELKFVKEISREYLRLRNNDISRLSPELLRSLQELSVK